MAQKTFTFSKYFGKTYDKDYRPTGFLSAEGEFRAKMLRQGYLINDVKVRETITISCFAARANVSLKEREKLQKNLPKIPKDKIVLHRKKA